MTTAIETDVELALALAGDDLIPCVSDGCEQAARWVVYLGHVSPSDCPMRPAIPQCTPHKIQAVKIMRIAGHWPGIPAVTCEQCGAVLSLDHVDPIQGA